MKVSPNRFHVWLLLLLIACLSASVSAQSSKQRRSFRRAFRPSDKAQESQEARVSAIASLAAFDTQLAVELFAEAWMQVEAEALESEEDQQPYLWRGFRDKRLELRAELNARRELHDLLAAALLECKTGEALAWMWSQAQSDPKLPMTLRLLMSQRAPEAPDWKLLAESVKRARKVEDIDITLSATKAAGPAEQAASDFIVECLSHDDAGIRELAAQTAASLALPAAIEPLIAGLEGIQGRTLLCFVHALEVLTDAHIGRTSTAWQQWFEREGASYVAGEHSLGAGIAKAKGGGQGPSYYGISLTGESVLFLFDSSRSMDRALSDGSRKPEPGEKSRFSRAQEDLMRALGALPTGSHFNVITFAGSLQLFSESPVEVNEDSIT
ncbi:MAG: hypothetical protein ACI835_003804 [Planctomycetota bacterium]|jgi:hypothetical protein